VNELLVGLVGALVATNQPLAVSNLIQQQAGVTVQIPNAQDPAETELRDIMIEDDAAVDEVDQWVQSNNILRTQGKGESNEELNKRIIGRFDTVRKHYQAFLERHPNYTRGYLAFGSFLNEIGEEDNAKTEFENARQLDPKNPAAWNNLANYYGEYGPVTNSFSYYEEAMRLDPTEPVYIHNLATTVYLFRRDAEQYYHCDEPGVFDRALDLYRRAMKVAPKDFVLATDYADSYYEIKPLRTNDVLMAWTNAYNVAQSDAEREGVDIHFARIKIMIGRFAEAQAHLNEVTNQSYSDLKARMERNLNEREHPQTNAAANAAAPINTNSPAVSNSLSAAETNQVDPTPALEVARPKLHLKPSP
jgi:tetratricopeptide (TPR) repeat protein